MAIVIWLFRAALAAGFVAYLVAGASGANPARNVAAVVLNVAGGLR